MKTARSCAEWSNGLITKDEHETQQIADRVCKLLEEKYPKLLSPSNYVVKTWTEPTLTRRRWGSDPLHTLPR